MNKFISGFLFLLLAISCAKNKNPNVLRPEVSHAKWDELLNVHVDTNGMVDYQSFKADEGALDNYLKLIASNHPNENWNKNARKAYWINAYNAFTIKLVLDHYPVESIRDIKKGIPFVNSVWDLGDGTIIYDELNFSHTYIDTGTYIIKYFITNQYNCSDSVIENLVINPVCYTYIPSSFTPNDDGINDYFYPSVIGGNNYNMIIYDRWGGIIYQGENGEWNGENMPTGIYSYSIEVVDYKNKIEKGKMYKAILIRSSKNFKRKNGFTIKFKKNAIILLNERGSPLASRIKGPLYKEFRSQYFSKILILSNFSL